MPLEYFCYVSRAKVDSLYEQLDPKAYYELSETQTKQVDVTVSAHANWGIGQILSLFRAGGSYGRKGVLQRDSKLKMGYVEKLRKVLAALATESAIRPITALDGAGVVGMYYHCTGLFRVAQPLTDPHTDQVVTLVCDVGGRPLLLDASLRYFSEGPQPDGSFNINSSNHRFFSGDLPLTMKTVFLLLQASPERVVGSPLFLQLALAEGDYIVLL
jgi:hypothetical protein